MKASHILLFLFVTQVGVFYQIIPSSVEPFNAAHEDLLTVLLLIGYFIVSTLEGEK